MVVLGANDKQKFHDELEDVQAEMHHGEEEVNSALMPSFLAQKVVVLKLTIYLAQELPVMDQKSRIGLYDAGGDFYVKVEHAEFKRKSRVVTVTTKEKEKRAIEQRRDMNPMFMEQFEIPIISHCLLYTSPSPRDS